MRGEKLVRLSYLLCSLVVVQSPELSAGDRKSDYLELRRLIGKEKFEEAIERCKKLIEVYPDYFYLYETLAEVSQYAGTLDEAKEYFEERIEDGREVELAYYGLGLVYSHNEEYRSAVFSYQKAIELGLDRPECYASYCNAYERLKGVDSAIRYFGFLCHRNPDNANFWYALARAYWRNANFAKMLQCLEEALLRNRKEPTYLAAKAVALLWEDQIDEGTELLNQLLPLAEERGDITTVQFLRWNVSQNYDRTNRRDLSVAEAQRVIKDAKEFGLFRWLGWGYVRLANAENHAANFENGLMYAAKALATSRLAYDDRVTMEALIAQFEAHIELGNFEDAIDRALATLRLAQKKGYEWDYILAYAIISRAYHEMGYDRLALDYAIETLMKAEEANVGWDLFRYVHSLLGNIQEGLGNYHIALNHYLRCHKLIAEKELYKRDLATIHGSLGNVYLKIGDLEKARRHLQNQLRISRSIGYSREEAYSLTYLGDYYFETEQYRLSSQSYHEGLQLSQRLRHGPITLLCARGLAQVAEATGKPREALSWYEMAIATSESMGYGQRRSLSDISSGKDLDIDYRNSVRLLCALGDVQTAFETAERAKVRTDMNLITVSQRKIAEVMSDSSRARILGIRSDLERKHARLAIESEKALSGEDDRNQLSALNDIANLEVEYRKLLDNAKARDPGYYNLLNPTVMSVGDLQMGILEPDQAILEYVVGDEQTEVFVVKPDTLLHFTIRTSREELSDLINRMSFLFSEDAEGLEIWNPALANFDVKSCHELYRLLVEPVANQLNDVDHIIVVADDVLKRVPFEVLVTEVPDDTDHVGFEDVKFLIDGFELSYAPAASLLDPRFRVEKRPRKLLLALGNPTLSENGQKSGEEILLVTLRHTKSLPILPGAEKEVGLISRVFDHRADLFVGDEASKTVFKQLAPQYKILHLAAHASVDNVRPLHSSIYLSGDAESNDDGTLRAFEFFNLELNADLAVLSACNTGGVREGQGLEGLVRGLVFAGVPSVVATLWVVEDEATAMLMERFYSYLKQGERKSRALQLAKVDLIRAGKSDPFYWAGFVLIGDASPIDFSDIDSKREWAWVAVLSLMVGLIEVIVYRKVVTE